MSRASSRARQDLQLQAGLAARARQHRVPVVSLAHGAGGDRAHLGVERAADRPVARQHGQQAFDRHRRDAAVAEHAFARAHGVAAFTHDAQRAIGAGARQRQAHAVRSDVDGCQRVVHLPGTVGFDLDAGTARGGEVHRTFTCDQPTPQPRSGAAPGIVPAMPAGPLRFDASEVREVLRMIEAEHLDIRAVTMGISLRDCATDELSRTCERVYEKIMRSRSGWCRRPPRSRPTYGVPITNKRISVTPIALVGEPTRAARVRAAAPDARSRGARAGHRLRRRASRRRSRRAARPAIAVLIDSIPEALSTTTRVCSSVNVATTRAGINMDAVARHGAHHQGARRARPPTAAASAAPSW